MRARCARGEKASVGTVSGVVPVSTVLLLLFDFIERLAIDAQRRGGACFETLDADFDAASFAKTVIIAVDQIECGVEFFYQFALTVASAMLEAEIFFLRRAVGGIGKVGSFIFHVRNGAIDFFHQFGFPLTQDLAEMILLPVAHVLLALLRLVRLEVFKRGGGG